MAGPMNAPTQIRDDSDEQPLDPAVERVRRRVMRLMFVSVAIMMVGLIAVVGAIVYKLSARGGSVAAGAAGAERRLALPPGASVISATLSGEDILFVVDPGDGGRQQFWVYRIGEDRIVARIALD